MRRSASSTDGGSNDRTKDAGSEWFRPLTWVWSLFVQNRIAIAIASLIWLVWRSGTQPRRLAYPCQQAAAANLGFLAVLFIPGLAKIKARQAATVRQRAMTLAMGSVCLAGLMFILISGGIAVYSEYVDNAPMAAPPPYTALGDPTTVAIVKEDPVTNIEQMVRDAIALAGGLDSLINDNDTVVIMPNLVSLDPNTPGDGRCTRWEVVAAVVEVVKEAGNTVTVKLVEGSAWTDGGNDGRITDNAYQSYGYDNNSDGWFDADPTVELVDLNDTGGWDSTSGATWVNISSNAVLRSGYYVHNTLHNADVFISVPTFKNHSNAGYTGALKNQIGSAPGDLYYNRSGNKQPLHRALHFCGSGIDNCDIYYSSDENTVVGRSIVDLNLAKTIDFTVIDGLVGITDGPGGTNTPPTGYMKMIVAGADALAVDTVCTVAMGYEQESIGHLEWAASTNALGTNDLDAISVVGDHVDAVRDYWFPNYAGAVQENDKTNPSITGINLTNGQEVSGIVSIVGSGISDSGSGTVGVIKSELEVDSVLVATDTTNNSASFTWNSTTVVNGTHEIKITVYDDALNEDSITRNVTVDNNLVANGDFSSGLTNWMAWSGGWGNGTQAIDNGALKLACTAGGSFGVYQEISTTSTHVYSIDVQWEANKYGENNNWYEIMLIDGPFSTYEADSGGAAVVPLNHMYAHDLNSSANCPSGNPIPADFDWVWTHTQNDENVDNCWNDRDGQRTASGSTMTVVLKAGAFGGQAMAWFDGVSVVDVTGGSAEVCNNNVDDDLDGYTDCDDSDCDSDPVCHETGASECSNGIDDDDDGLTDCCDDECAIESFCGTEVGYCADGIDNDCDGDTDGPADDDCTETGAECIDGSDNDGDGQADCCDSDCDGVHASCMTEVGFCSDGVDNDCDGAVDGSDGDCNGGATVILTETFSNGTADLGIGAPDGWQLVWAGPPSDQHREYFGSTGQIITGSSHGQPDPGSYDGGPGTLAVQVLCVWNNGGNQYLSSKQLQYVTFATAPGNTYHVSAWVNTVKVKRNADWDLITYPNHPWKTGDQPDAPDDAFADIQIGLKNGSDVNVSDLDTVYTPVTSLLDNMSYPDPHDAWVQTQTQLVATSTQMSLILKVRSFDIASAADCDLDVRWDNITVTDLGDGTCAKPVLAGAVSRKTHGTAGNWDIDVGDGEIECRSAQLGTGNPNALKIIADFDPAVGEIDLLGGSDVTTDNGVVSAVTQTGPLTLEIDITNLGDRGDPSLSTFNTQVNLAFPGVICMGNPSSTCDSTLCIRVIVGDYDWLGRTNFIDFAEVRNAGYVNDLVSDYLRARADFDCSGRVNFIDFAKVKTADLINATAPACPDPPMGP